jgi:hypothetical protein
MNPTLELTHPVVVVTDDQGAYRSECGCGWASDWYFCDDRAAEDAGAEHIEIAVGPPDPMDQLMSGLLDLQADLAEVVIWLADHWSAALPVPYPTCPRYGHEGTAALSVYCSDGLDQLHQVAELLDQPVTHRPDYDQGDRRYWHVCRTFGRVTLDAWGLDP